MAPARVPAAATTASDWSRIDGVEHRGEIAEIGKGGEGPRRHEVVPAVVAGGDPGGRSSDAGAAGDVRGSVADNDLLGSPGGAAHQRLGPANGDGGEVGARRGI